MTLVMLDHDLEIVNDLGKLFHDLLLFVCFFFLL